MSTLVAPFLSHTKFFMADMCLFDICGLWCVVHWQQQQCLMGGCRDRWGFLWGPLGPHLGNGLFFVDDIPFRCELDIVKSHTIQFFLLMMFQTGCISPLTSPMEVFHRSDMEQAAMLCSGVRAAQTRRCSEDLKRHGFVWLLEDISRYPRTLG